MVADTQFHHAVGDLKIRLAYRRNDARGKADTDGAALIDSLLCDANHAVQIITLGCSRTANFPHENFTRHSTALGDIFRRSGGHIVVGHDRADVHLFAGGHFHRQLDVHIVASIVAVKACNARALIGSTEGVKETLGSGRGEDFANSHGINQAGTDITYKCRLMA
ncbi:hypothetical protein D3C75_989470 [compost metagenome]